MRLGEGNCHEKKHGSGEMAHQLAACAYPEDLGPSIHMGAPKCNSSSRGSDDLFGLQRHCMHVVHTYIHWFWGDISDC